MPITWWWCVCMCVSVYVGGGSIYLLFSLHLCREGKWKSPLYRMKASEDYPLTMKFDDPPSPSDTDRVQLNIALGTKPWSLQCERTTECVVINSSVFSFFHKKRLPHSSSLYIVHRMCLNCIQSVINSTRGWMTHRSCERIFSCISLRLIT